MSIRMKVVFLPRWNYCRKIQKTALLTHQSQGKKYLKNAKKCSKKCRNLSQSKYRKAEHISMPQNQNYYTKRI